MQEGQPWRYPQEEQYFQSVANKVIFEDNSQKLKLADGNMVLTTHRILFFKGPKDCLEVPLWYVGSTDTTGGLGIMNTKGVTLANFNKSGLPPFVSDYYHNVRKMTQILVKPPRLAGS